jgi:hypothetical protein
MRLAAVEKLGYYPTPTLITTLVSKWLKAPEGMWRLLDPCAGKGEAAAQLAQAVGGDYETWGVEIAPARAEEATRVLNKVHNTAWQAVRVTKNSVSLLWLNPPYDNDYDGSDRRVEIEFLRTTIPTLVHGGVLVYIVPRRLLGYEAAARLLAGHFDNLVIRRFPDGEYERFHQVVVLGTRKTWERPTGEQVTAIRSLTDADLLPLGEPESPWPLTIPAAPAKARFRRVDVSDREKIAQAHALGWPEDLVESLKPQERAVFRPAMPLKKGHVAMLMASGLMGTMRLEKNGRRLLGKGRVVKHTDESTEVDEKGKEVTVRRERFVTTVGLVSSDGVRILDDVEGMTDFMEEHGDEIAAEILKNPPLYDLKPTPQEWEAVSALGRNRKPLPGQKEPGLLDVQKHAAIALARACRAHGNALIQGEMGLGKTTIALATIDLLGAYPALVMCPPHLVPKWLREAKEVIPGVQVRELKRIGRNGGEGEVNDVRRFVEDWRNGLLGDKAIAVVASTSAKLGSGWKGAVATRYTLPKGKKRTSFRAALERYKEARNALRGLVELGADPEVVEEQRRITAEARRRALAAAVPYPVCPVCGQVQVERKKGAEEQILDFRPFDRKARTCDRRVSGWARNEDGEAVWVWAGDNDARNVPTCGSPLYTFGANHRRWPIADYIAAKARGFFKMLVADEVHQYKGKASDRGLAFHRLVNATRYQLALTGTFYGGKATSIFWLMHRLRMGNTHRDFAYNDERRWVRQYGVLETRVYGNGKKDEDDADDFGAFNATRRRRVYVQEKPGVSPAVLHRIIGNSVFLSLADLGIALPPYAEEVALVGMTPAQAEQYRRMEGLLRARARDDHRYLSTWLQWSLNRPDSAFRDEVVEKVFTDDDGNVVKVERLLDLPAVVDGALLPKEEFLDFAKSEVATGRKVLVYVRQTGTRDIQPRLRDILRRAGLRAEILSSGVDTRRREAWIEKNGHRTDVLIVNPRLVETGLDLVQFATVVFYEIDYSLYTVWQAMRRVWRLGQSEPVKVVFVGYAETLEEKALALMGRKMKAAQLLYGDEVGGAIVPEEDGDFLTELARTVLEERELPDLKALFAAVKQETQSPLGSPTAQSPRLPVYTEEQLRALWLAEMEARAAQRRRRTRVPEGQLSLL